MRAIWALAMKDIRLLVRDRAGLFFTLVFPLVYALLFGAMFGGMFAGGKPTSMKITVADLDGSAQSRALIQTLQDAEGMTLTLADDETQARDRVRRRDAGAAVIIPSGYGKNAASPFAGQVASVDIVIDPSRAVERGLVEGLVTQAAYQQFQKVFTEPAAARDALSQARSQLASVQADDPAEWARLLPLRVLLDSAEGFFSSDIAGESPPGEPGSQPFSEGWQPVKINVESVTQERGVRPRTAWDITFPQALVWGLMSCSFGFALSLVIERRSGTLMRLQVAPAPRWQILAGKALGCFLMNMLMLAMLLGIGIVALGIRPTSALALVAIVLSAAVAFVGIMMLLSVCGKTEASVNGFGWAAMMVLAMIGGAMMPLIFMPDWMKTVGAISPIRWAVEGLEGAIWRGYSPAEMAVPCAVLLSIGLAGFLVGWRVFDWKGGE